VTCCVQYAYELKFVKDIAAATGIVLDPVYRYNNFFMRGIVSHILYASPSIRAKKYSLRLIIIAQKWMYLDMF
jgi:hypothetical protein